MDELPNECLTLIFELLPIKDRIRIEGVCRRWKEVSQDSWRRCKRLDSTSATWLSQYGDWLYLYKPIFDKVLRLSGQYLTSITLDESEDKYICLLLDGHNILKEICQSCPNIEELDLLAVPYMNPDRDRIIPWLKPLSSKLRRLGLHMKQIPDSLRDLSEFFGTMKKLKSIRLCHDDTFWDGELLIGLPLENLEEIGFRSAFLKERDFDTFNSVIRKSTGTWHTLYFSRMRFEPLDLFIESISSNFALKNFTFNGNYHYLNGKGIRISSYLSKLTYLETLNIGDSYFVDDQVVEVIANNCQRLKELNISGTKVTEAGILYISALRELRCLKMKFLKKKMIHPMLEKFINLEELNCYGCNELECSSLCAFVLKATDLRVLNVSECGKVENELILASIEALKTREDISILNIIAKETKINVNTLREMPETLNVVMC